ncbi:FAD/NAD(P)-binding domain-containing protein [Durotheca rogersii]|uniref:FAD/NAD(P)-binding domain-containing protein n=1 Tax=Durotheca rogersii TaxID=419775 RepID=UPI00221E67C1|nr:FAD/NAD(P)-binding domain-containing protein [Durotheca rogersii]KAI5865157.1 FAD/NAD(P)-binding domain-containing protein [Durotheca rogersii]
MAKTVVILGGAYAGVSLAHRLLKQTKPHVKDLKVILVSKNSHFYWNMASVRAIVPGALKEEQYSIPIEPGFAKYGPDSFEFVVGTAEGIDLEGKTVRVSVAAAEGKAAAGERAIAYDHLVLATGTRSVDAAMPWKAAGSGAEVLAVVAGLQERVRAAKHIVVAGAGTTGCEVAAELAYAYGKASKAKPEDRKEIVLLSGDPGVLGGDSLASSVAAELAKLGVETRPSSRVTGSRALEDGRTEVSLAGGDALATDLYLPTMGMAPNTEYVPPALLTERGFVDVDEAFRAKAAGAGDVWAAGDVVWKPRGSFVLTDKQAAGVAKNIDLALRGKPPVPVKTLPIDVMMVATGPERGAGRLGSVKVFSVFVYLIKGKTLGTQRLAGFVDGSAF